MKLKSLYLKNYANIYNAMEREEITIDFSKCKNRIVVIKSENGSGKSSIINELHPFFSSPNVWMDDREIVKIIEFFLDDGTILSITYFGWKAKFTKPKPSKCYIKRISPIESIELNPNGNMSSGKDIICDLLDINDDYMALSSISANSKGIGAMKPGERKRFMSLIVSAIAPYVKMYKLLASKHSALKSMITALTTKISQLGNIEVIQSSMDKATRELDILEHKKDDLTIQQADIQAKMQVLSQDGIPTEKYRDLINKRTVLGADIQDVPQEVINFSELELHKEEKAQVKLDTQIENLDQKLEEITQKEKEIRDSLESDTVKLNSLFDKSVLEDTEQRLEKSQKALEFYVSCFERLGFHAYDNITEMEYTMALDAIARFNSTIDVLGAHFTYDQVKIATKYLNTEYDAIDYDKLITNIENKTEELNILITEQNVLRTQSENYCNIPSDCKHLDDCPFIKTIVEAKKSLLSEKEYQTLVGSRDDLKTSLSTAKDEKIKQEELLSCIKQVRDLVSYITSATSLILKFPNTQQIKGLTHLLDCIVNFKLLDLDISAYREYTNYVTLISAAKRDIESYKDKINTLKHSSKESWALQKQIEKETTQLKEIYDSKSGELARIREFKNAKLLLDQRVDTLKTLRVEKTRYEENLKILDEINASIDKISKDVETYQNLETNLNNVTTDLNNLNLSSIPDLKNTIEQAKYQMILFDQYKKDYDEYSVMYDQIETVKQHTSVNGIQAEIMEITMNQILSMVNQLAAMMFGGRFVLKKFEITADDFLITFYDQELGIERPDISMMSASQLGQLSMIISFVLLHNSSEKYNIIRLDEVDNNLDYDNRLRFFNLVYMIMDILHFDQSIIISHNSELDLSSCDLIITRLQNVEAYKALYASGANIVADFMKL